MTEFNRLLGALGKPVAVLTGGLEVCLANQAFASLAAPASPNGERGVTDVAGHPTLGPVLRRAASRLRTVGWTVQTRWVRSSVEPQIFDLHLTRADHDRLVAVFDDVTTYLRVEEIQNRARLYLEAVLNHLNLGVIVLDSEFCVTFLNEDQHGLFRRLGVGRSIFEVIGAPVAELYPIFTPEEWDAARSRVIRVGEPVNWAQVPFPRRAPASYFDVDLMPLGTALEGLDGAICLTGDCTKTVGLERELARKDRLALVGQMTVALNHEINNPLTAVLGTAESLLFGKDLAPQTAVRIETIRNNAMRIVEVTRRLRQLEDIHLTEYVQGGPLMLDLQVEAK